VNAYRVISMVRLFEPLSAAYGSFLPVLNPVVIPGLCAGIILFKQCVIIKLD